MDVIESNSTYTKSSIFLKNRVIAKNQTIENVDFHECKMDFVHFIDCTLRNIRFFNCSGIRNSMFKNCAVENIQVKGIVSDLDFSIFRDMDGIRGVVYTNDEPRTVWKKAFASSQDIIGDVEGTHPDQKGWLRHRPGLSDVIGNVKGVENNIVEEVLVECILEPQTQYVVGCGKKCRAMALTVVRIWGATHMYKRAVSSRDWYFEYKVGEVVRPDNLSLETLNVNETCAPGVHFFFDAADAARYRI